MSSLVHLVVHISSQTLALKNPSSTQPTKTYLVSTAKNGLGVECGSEKTPLGSFLISAKYGKGCPPLSVFTCRIPRMDLSEITDDSGDVILGPILRLDGVDSENSNTWKRTIYFHGTNQESLIGQPVSHGCIRLKADDISDLYNRTPLLSPVTILP